jgi:hypothetical protein
MSVLGTIGICWLGLNGAVFVALATRKSRPSLGARFFPGLFGMSPGTGAIAAVNIRTRRHGTEVGRKMTIGSS